MGARCSERLARIHELELKRRENMHKTDTIARDEEARLLRLRLLGVRDEHAALKDKLSQKDTLLAAATKKSDQLRVELDDSNEAARAQGARIKKQEVELANLRAEVQSLNGALQDSGKALQDKFALTRELNRLRPEMEHLQSQLANYQAMVAEKNDLRRQLDSLEVELEHERRSRLRADDAAVAEVKARLDKADKKLAADKKEHERALAEAQAMCERLEERVEALRAKYKASQGELRETRAQLAATRAELDRAKTAAPRNTQDRPRKGGEPGTSRKRRAQELSFEDITIQTPGNDDVPSKRPAARRRGAEQAAVGEKSTFSITPFLSRTKNLSEESLEADASDVAGPDSTFVDKGESSGPPEAVAEPPTPDAAPKRRRVRIDAPPTKAEAGPKTAAKPRGRPKTKGLAEAPPARSNKTLARTAAAKSQPALEPVAEDQENAAPAAPTAAERDAGKKKRRKLLGAAKQTLLEGDGEDGEAARGKKRPRAQPLGDGARNAFAGGAFSPLKRDRRGANASFLA